MDVFMLAYIECALWSSTDDNEVPLDENYTVEDINSKTLGRMIADCERFQVEHGYEIDNAIVSSRYTNDERAGHDFWLTRNGHGAGFWDGDWPEPMATRLTNASKAYGEVDLYVGDDGRLYI